MKYYITHYYLPKEKVHSYNDDRILGKTVTDEIGKNILVVTPHGHQLRYAKNRYFDNTEFVSVPFFVCIKDSLATYKNAESAANKTISYYGITVSYLDYTEEACLSNLDEILETSFIGIGNDIVRKFNIKELLSAWENKLFIKDKVIKRDFLKCSKNIINNASISKSIQAETNNLIHKSHKANKSIPVHYIFEGIEKSNFEEACNTFVSFLIAKRRVESEHIFYLNFDILRPTFFSRYHDNTLDDIISDNMANCLSGNTIIVQYGLHDNEDEYRAENYYLFCNFIRSIKPYLDNTQLIIGIPTSKKDLQTRIQKQVDAPMVVIEQNKIPNNINNSYNELLSFMKNLAKKDGLTIDSRLKELLKNKIKDKSNWDVKKLYKDWKTSKLISEDYPQYMDELKNYLAINNQKEPNTMLKLNELIGLNDVKIKIKNILLRYKMSKYVESKGLPAEDFSLHMIFSGGPGTGKTEVANLLGQIFKEAGVLKEGRVIYNSGSLSTEAINALFKENHGSVLFFDEAYDFIRSGSITSLIANMERYRSDTIVILAGYEKHMEKLLSCNPGFKSRIGNIVKFPDYTNDELFRIFQLMCKRGQKLLSKKALSDIKDIIYRGGKPDDQGNARYIRNIYESCVSNQQVRLAKSLETNNTRNLSKTTLKTIRSSDIPSQLKNKISAKTELDRMIGLKKVKDTVFKRINFAAAQKLRRDNGIETEFLPMHMAFLGNPGTGKTEVARLIGKILAEEGILSVGKLFCSDPSTYKEPEIVNMIFAQAKGSVIFVDEAYSLAQLHPAVIGNFMKNMEDYRKEVVVIFAGYTKEVEILLNSNPGFKSRITTLIQFDDYCLNELISIAKLIANKHNYIIDKGAEKTIKEIIAKKLNSKNFGNGRFVRTLIEEAEINQGNRILRSISNPSKQQLKLLKSIDFENSNIANSSIKSEKIGFFPECMHNKLVS